MVRNHFREAELQGRPIQAGRLEGFEAVQLQPEDVTTHVLDVKAESEATAICIVPGVWTPEEGAKVNLQEPERTATVRKVEYLFDANGMSVSVWLSDPLTARAEAS